MGVIIVSVAETSQHNGIDVDKENLLWTIFVWTNEIRLKKVHNFQTFFTAGKA